MRSLDWQATVRGAVVAVAMILIGGVVAIVLGPSAQGTTGAAAFLIWALVAFLSAGWLAGGVRLDTPVAHGIAAAVLAAVVALVIPLAGGAGPGPAVGAVVRSATIVVVAATCGAGGGLLADQRQRRLRHRSRDRAAPAPRL
ncbi:MAG: hypothetical protein AAFN30_07595 [Actinomycetota bacterium]